MAAKPSSSSKGSSKGSKPSKASNKAGDRPARVSAEKKKALKSLPPPKQVKTKPGSQAAAKPKKKRRLYSDKELDLPVLNGIVPAGVQKPRGKKKGKVFVDDQESMMTILAMVNAEKEGLIESKVLKMRQMEEIREARRKEAETREAGRKERLEDKMREFKKSKGRPKNGDVDTPVTNGATSAKLVRSGKKRVSFA